MTEEIKDNVEDNIYRKLSAERKQMQADGTLPLWYTTGGWQMFKQKYLYEATTFKEQFERIANTAAAHAYRMYGDEFEWEKEFFNLFWNGDVSCSTPVQANMGTDRGLPVSCSGGYIEDSIDGFYKARHEAAMLTKHGFGTSGYLGDIRPRGTPISTGGKASGALPVLKGFVQDMRDVAQGTARRGAWAGYLEPTHGDFREVLHFMEQHPDDVNIGWVLTDEFEEKLDSGDLEAIDRWQSLAKAKMVTGKGYLFFRDKANRSRPAWYKEYGLDVKASNLCSEIMLHSSDLYTYTCVLSSMNAVRYPVWKDTNAVFFATVFLDCVAEEFIQRAKGIPGLEKAVAFTEKGRALGLGLCGLHTLCQMNSMPFEGLEAHMLSTEIAKHIHTESERASRYMAERAGEVEWTKGYGLRNTHRIAIAPTKSTALLMGGISEGINPDPAMAYIQPTAAGEILRVNPVLLALLKEKGQWNKRVQRLLEDSNGSVQGPEFDEILTPHEKQVFKTAFEMDMMNIIRMADARQRWIDQGQSLNLFFAADESERYISSVLKAAWKSERILAIYYIYTQAGVQASKDECVACQ